MPRLMHVGHFKEGVEDAPYPCVTLCGVIMEKPPTRQPQYACLKCARETLEILRKLTEECNCE